MNQYQILKSRSVTSMVGSTQLWNRTPTRRLVDSLVRFHPSLTDRSGAGNTGPIYDAQYKHGRYYWINCLIHLLIELVGLRYNISDKQSLYRI